MSVRSLRPPYAADSCCPGSLPGRPGEPCPAGQRQRNASSTLRASNRSEKRPSTAFRNEIALQASCPLPGGRPYPGGGSFSRLRRGSAICSGTYRSISLFPRGSPPMGAGSAGLLSFCPGVNMNLPRNTCSFLSVPIANARNTWYPSSMKVSAPFMRTVFFEL